MVAKLRLFPNNPCKRMTGDKEESTGRLFARQKSIYFNSTAAAAADKEDCVGEDVSVVVIVVKVDAFKGGLDLQFEFPLTDTRLDQAAAPLGRQPAAVREEREKAILGLAVMMQ